ncbi:MAG: hypothetical protein ACFB12_27495 [Leptolyngbyaceae cyanobacterium]
MTCRTLVADIQLVHTPRSHYCMHVAKGHDGGSEPGYDFLVFSL